MFGQNPFVRNGTRAGVRAGKITYRELSSDSTRKKIYIKASENNIRKCRPHIRSCSK